MTHRPRRPGRKPALRITVRYPHITIGGGLYAAIGSPPEVGVTWHAGILLIGPPECLPGAADWPQRIYTINPVRQEPRSDTALRPLARTASASSSEQEPVRASDSTIYRSPRISAQTALKESGLADGSYLGQVEHGYLRILYPQDAVDLPAPAAGQATSGTASGTQEWWTIREIEALCGLSHTALYRAIKAGVLVVDPVQSTRLKKKIVSRAALVDYLRFRQATIGEEYPEFLSDAAADGTGVPRDD